MKARRFTSISGHNPSKNDTASRPAGFRLFPLPEPEILQWRYTVMATYFEQFQSGFGRALPDFNLLKVGKHTTDPRAATSIVIVGMAISLCVMLSLALGEPARQFNRIKTGERVAPPPAADKVTIVATPRMDVPNLEVPCAEQTWPYIDRRCLTESTQKRPQPESRPAEPAVAAPPVDARSVATAPVAPAINPPASSGTQTGAPPQDIAPQAREWVADSNAIMQNETDDEEWVPIMPPPEQQYRRDRRRHYDQGREIERHFRHFTRQLFPRF